MVELYVNLFYIFFFVLIVMGYCNKRKLSINLSEKIFLNIYNGEVNF